ncbi:MAG: hypothetical protein ACRD3C_10515 [Vicinamibacterales bacterium]
MRVVAVPGVALALLLVGAMPTFAQALGDVAKQEAERRKVIGAPGKVYTNDSLRAETPSTSAPGAAPPVQPAPQATPASPGVQAPASQDATAAPPAEPAPATEEAWRTRITGARDAVSRSQIFVEALQSRINALTTDFVNRDDPAQRDTIAAERQKALAELDRVKREIVDQQKAIVAIQDEARRAGVPPGWLR